MKRKTLFSIVVAVLTAAASLFAAPPFEREFQQLKDQHEKALATANDPIIRRYKAALEQLISRATQAKDLETAVKAKAELNDPSTTLLGTSWLWGGDASMKFTFLPSGRFSGHFKDATWRVLSPDLIYYSWPGNAYSGVMRITKDLDRIDAAEWQVGKSGSTPVSASKAPK